MRPENVLEKILLHPECRTYFSLFNCAYELPIFLNRGGISGMSNSGSAGGASIRLSPSQGDCRVCPAGSLTSKSKPEPGAWKVTCRAGLQMVAVPVPVGSETAAWLFTGHVPEGGAPARSQLEIIMEKIAPDRPVPGHLNDLLSNNWSLSASRFERAGIFLGLIGEMLGCEMNSIYTGQQGNESPAVEELRQELMNCRNLKMESISPELAKAFKAEVGISPFEFLERCRLGEVRRMLRAGKGSASEIDEAARFGGWRNKHNFLRVFSKYFHESPAEHLARSERVHAAWSTFQFG